MSQEREFGRIRGLIWPIHFHELKKFIPLTLMFFLMSFNYSVLRNLKDLFVMDTAGAEALYYIKTAAVTPMVIFYTLLYNSLSNSLGRHKLFYGVVAYFTLFFAAFAFFLYPNAEALTLSSAFETLNNAMPALFGLWASMKYWFYALFYVHAELWGTFGISVILWTFINEITSVKQSKRFYSFLALGANIALLFSASFLKVFGNEQHMITLIYIVIACGVLIMLLYGWFTSKIKAAPAEYEIPEKQVKTSKLKLSMWESAKFLLGSRYLRLIATLVFSYGFVISLVEAAWKSQVKAFQKASGGAIGALADVYALEVFLIGITSILLILFASSWIIKRSWKLAALITPILAATLGAVFFAFMLFGRDVAFFRSAFGVSSLFLAVMVGMLQVVIIKAFKYTLFDPTKEAAYIPLDAESKIKGKAAVDGIGGRLGKSAGSSLLASFLIPVLGGGKIDGAIPYLFIVIAVVLVIWIKSVISLDAEFKKLNAKAKE